MSDELVKVKFDEIQNPYGRRITISLSVNLEFNGYEFVKKDYESLLTAEDKQLIEDKADMICPNFRENGSLFRNIQNLLTRFHKKQDIYLKIESGSRTGSIVKMNPKYLLLHKYPKNIIYRFPGFDNFCFYNNYSQFYEFGFDEDPSFDYTHINNKDFFLFDDGKSIPSNYKMLNYISFLPNYDGPTVNIFTRTKTDKKQVSDIAYNPIDVFGNKLEKDDTIVLSHRRGLKFVKLIKVFPSGIIRGIDIMDKTTINLTSSYDCHQTKTSKENVNFLKFDKNFELSKTLMMEKLKR